MNIRINKLLIVTLTIFSVSCTTNNSAVEKKDVISSPVKIKSTSTETQCLKESFELSNEEWLKRQSGYGISEEARFFSENHNKNGVITLPSGVQYKVLRRSCGSSPKLDSVVKVRYHMTLLNGAVIDSSYNRKETPNFILGSVIPGWSEAVSLMQTGAIWEIYVPSSLAYLSEGMGPVPKNAGLVFTVELIDFY